MLKKWGYCGNTILLQDNVELLEVNLSWNGIGEEGSIAFGKHLQKNHTLRILDISYSRINLLHLGHVLKGLKYNDTLDTLKVNMSDMYF
jgi:Ran GTPase-activating protein (RanGAP) involved in mRNA processing and transport